MSSNKHRWQIRIEHILEAISKIQWYTAGLSEEAFAAEEMAVGEAEALYACVQSVSTCRENSKPFRRGASLAPLHFEMICHNRSI